VTAINEPQYITADRLWRGLYWQPWRVFQTSLSGVGFLLAAHPLPQTRLDENTLRQGRRGRKLGIARVAAHRRQSIRLRGLDAATQDGDTREGLRTGNHFSMAAGHKTQC